MLVDATIYRVGGCSIIGCGTYKDGDGEEDDEIKGKETPNPFGELGELGRAIADIIKMPLEERSGDVADYRLVVKHVVELG